MDEANIPPAMGSEALSPLAALQPEPERNKILYGPNGLRAGWRILIFLLILGGIVGALVLTAHYAAILAGAPPNKPGKQTTLAPGIVAVGDAATFGLLLLVSWIMTLIERRTVSHYGLPLRTPFPKNFWVGLLWGFLAISGVLFVMFLFHGVRITGIDTHGSALGLSALEWAFAFVMVGLSEEFMFRGYMQFTLTTGIGFWPAALVTSALFTYVHKGNPGESPLGLFQVAAFGIFACIALQRTGDLWWPIGFHAAWDWGQTFFYGVPDSGLKASHNFLHTAFYGKPWLTGGSTGPEGSVLTLVALIVASLLVIRQYREVRYPDPDALGLRFR
ncbi:MAG TPA: type II CAAX endopeptidase family protein [Candidatus Acidoferrales bacterium]|nr:type II CAAX endopeptidase family protein [Candidatus Acidoferrales bacterium]